MLQTLDWARRGPLGAPLGCHSRGALRRPKGLIVALSHKRGGRNHSGEQHKLLEHHGTVMFEHVKEKEKLFNVIEGIAGDVDLLLI